MALHELYVKDARVWIPHTETVWQGAVITRAYERGDKTIYLRPDSGGQEQAVAIAAEKDMPPLRNPIILIGTSDLTALSYLHEPDVLYNLQVRFCDRQTIYTYCGIILVAINPYAELPLYGQDLIQAYRGHPLGELEPHIFAIAEDAYTKLEREKCNLSIIVSGESGAGKTVSAKYAMRYFAAVGGSESETNIERKVMASSPIMEAIGNAKTTRNDNSSRFGKFTKLLFTCNREGLMALTGATMQTYLLEKSRVVFQAPEERNYHIFYQLCAARDKWPELMLDHQDNFRFLNQGDCPDIVRVSDLEQFAITVSAFLTLGFTQEDVGQMMKILAAILHLGNIQFHSVQTGDSGDHSDISEECTVSQDDLHLGILCDLLRLDHVEMRKWLTTRQIESVNEVVDIPMNVVAAENARDALSKHIYAKLFQHIVDVVNSGLTSAGNRKNNCFIGVLDIYGFETFQTNSFEQFCINYANEKLQQQFNQHVFKLEQEEYLREGIVWTMIDFYDNQPCIDLIEAKLGILDMLDEECRMPRGSDQSWVRKLTEKCGKYKHFEKTKFGDDAFLVRHFSDTVQYAAKGFLEKNRDTVSKELVNVLVESAMPLCRQLMIMEDVDHAKDAVETGGPKVVVSAAKLQATPSKQHKKTVGSQFRDSLSLLIATLHSTTPHYVRCIKPNDDKVAFEWEPSKIVQQLRACGVLETVRISAAGFPSRWAYEDFVDRYHLLGKEKQLNVDDVTESSRAIIGNWITNKDMVRYGKTQIFFRAGQVAYLEQHRAEVRKKYIIIIQSLARRFVHQRRYKQIRTSVLGIQRYARGLLARRKAEAVRQNRAAVRIQRTVRGWLCRLKYQRTKQAIVRIQARCRGYLARQRYAGVLDNFKATIVQRFCRGYLARRRFAVKLERIVKCQAAIRRFLARRQYKRLRAEARTVVGIKKKYMGLENKIISMQQKMDSLLKENVELKREVSVIPELKARTEFMKNLENETKALQLELQAKQERVAHLQAELTQERDEKMQILQEKIREEEEWTTKTEDLRSEIDILQENVKVMQNKKLQYVQEERKIPGFEMDDMQEVYQRTVKEKEVLENENSSLREELKRILMNNNNRESSSLSMTSQPMSTVSSSHNEEDYGYASAKNTLEIKKEDKTPPKNSSTTMILKLRKLLEEEKQNTEYVKRQLARYMAAKRDLHQQQSGPEDRIRLSELEIENERLKKDYDSLRLGITRGVESQVLQDHYVAQQEELKRRVDEIVQLKAVLAEQAQSNSSMRNDMDRFQDSADLLEAFQAQKLVNRQLESELTALTEEHNVALLEFSQKLDESRLETNKLQAILDDKLLYSDMSDDTLNTNYLRHELEKVVNDYLRCQEELHELRRMNQILIERLRDHGLNDSIVLNEDMPHMAAVNKKPQTYQGIFKYRHEDEGKIIQRLVTDYTPKVAVTLQPGLPAYIFLMCIRYTDIINTDQYVRTLLTNYMNQAKKFFQLPHPPETRLLWLVNMLRLYNLLRQYGGMEEFMKLNSETQNQQQLKNFDLTEYRRIIYEKVVYFYHVLVKQVQDSIKPFIVPALLEHDEMARSKKSTRKSQGPETSPVDPTSLVQTLKHFYQQCKYFGLEKGYTEQLFRQVFYYICAVALNNLMLRSDLCTWRTGMKIRYNIGVIRSFSTSEMGLAADIFSPLDALADVSTLLQLRKSEDDVASICDLCARLTSTQILRIIKSYRLDDAEQPITPKFIERLTQELESRAPQNSPFAMTGSDKFTVDESVLHPLQVTYDYSNLRLEDIEVPPVLGLRGVLTKI